MDEQSSTVVVEVESLPDGRTIRFYVRDSRGYGTEDHARGVESTP